MDRRGLLQECVIKSFIIKGEETVEATLLGTKELNYRIIFLILLHFFLAGMLVFIFLFKPN